MFTEHDLRHLAARASSIDDRLAGGFLVVETPDVSKKIARRIGDWCEVATGGDMVLFERRLARDGIDLDEIAPLLGDVEYSPDTKTPAWVQTFARAFAAMMEASPQDPPPGAVDPEHPIPFEHLFIPVATIAYGLLDIDQSLLSDQARGDLQHALIHRLGEFCAPALFDGFVLARMYRNSNGLSVDFPGAASADSCDQYNRYLGDLRDGELRAFFTDRPVLARLVGTIVAQWIDTVTQFMGRLKNDWEELCNAYNDGDELGPVVGVKWGLSDAHNGGKTVCRLTFECGVTVGYKPKDLHIDVAWVRLLAWLGTYGAPPSARAPRTVAKQGYGWVEWLEPSPCRDAADAHGYFRRSGAMLCLFHLLQGTDFHFENVLAIADTPAPIDLETLLHPRVVQFADRAAAGSADAVASERLLESVLSTGFLPRWMALPGGRVAGFGGLYLMRESDQSGLAFRHVNSDAMAFDKRESAQPRPASHIPTLDGRVLSAADYPDDVIGGFADMYRSLLGLRHELLAPEGPFQEFDGRTVRAVLRPTMIYAAMLRRSVRRQSLLDGVEWSLSFDFLSRLSDLDDNDDLLTRVQSAERHSLQQLDVPYFCAQTDGTDLMSGDGSQIKGGLSETSFDALRQYVDTMTEARLATETEFIRLALKTGEDDISQRQSQPWKTTESESKAGRVTLSADVAVKWACDIAEILDRNALRSGDGSAWIGSVPLPGEERSQLELIGHHLYSGSTGVALFLSALHRVTGDAVHSVNTLSALRPFRDLLDGHEERARLARIMGIGGATGLGAAVYAFVRTAHLLGDTSLLDDVGRCADLVTLDAIAEDRNLDVISGSAGTLLALLALYDAKPDAGTLEKADACARHIVAEQVQAESAGAAWKTLDGKLLTGFSHGAAGIAYALLRLHAVVGDEALRSAAQDAIRYEQSLYSPDEKNWPDLRFTDQKERRPEYVCQWCHGAAGIGLARLGGLDALSGAAVQDDIDIALEATLNMPRTGVDHLCCGNFGRLEILFTAGQRLGRSDLMATARDRAEQIVRHAKAAGSFNWIVGEDQHNPGFFSGLSGAGYSLLRFTHPDLLPSVLLWE